MNSARDEENPIGALARLTGGNWKHLAAAREFTPARRKELQAALAGLDSDDTSIVVFGSLARDEATGGSDTDWTLLVDGIADPQHAEAAQEIRTRLGKMGSKEPGREGTFGDLAFSHQVLHWIGGEEDSNANTTRRTLLLLESKPIGNPAAWDRVIKNVLSRYIIEDRGLWSTSKERSVPLFLLNDISRYWRTVVVDFAYKQRSRGNSGYALRSIKLGLSRKLTFVSGLLACFGCRLDVPPEEWKEISETKNAQRLIEVLRKNLSMSPLEALAHRLLPYENAFPISKQLFDAYDTFVGLMADEKPTTSGDPPRKHLEKLSVDLLESDEVYQHARGVRNDFGKALKKLFLEPNTELYNLTLEFGVF